MPELPEVETVKETLKGIVLNKKIVDVDLYYYSLISYPLIDEFIKNIKGQVIVDIKRRGKWLLFELNDYYLLSHLRMEGKFNICSDEKISKHEHICFNFSDGSNLRYHDTRKFGRMFLYNKDEVFSSKPLCDLGYEPWDERLTVDYLRSCFFKKRLAIKTVLLDQSIFVGLGNIYVNEVLFMCKINPYMRACELLDNEILDIINNSRIVLEKAIALGGTTVKSFSSSEGVHGLFQNELLVHTKIFCPNCNSDILKEFIGGRGTYYCPKCQRVK